MSVLMLELNEVNFDQVREYADRGKLPTLGKMIAEHGVTETVSETRYDELEPWIQWVTAHTGLSFAEHGVFRLGDAVGKDLRQIWETLENQGLKVGAISPMNAPNRCRDAAFFVPDPWTPTRVTGSPVLTRLYDAIAQAVNDNAQSRLTPSSAAWLLAGMGTYARPANYGVYLSLLASAARRRPWARALVLDQLLADVFLGEVKRKRPDFASLFLNAAAHIQHHYLFNSAVYSGPHSNPDWYVPKNADPVLEVYELYDRIVGQVRNLFPEARLLLATGLHQDPHPEVTFYWRLNDHAAFLRKVGVPMERVEPRMSRDFVVYCTDADQALAAQRRLEAIKTKDGVPLFEVDNRGNDLFVVLTWPNDIGEGFEYRVDNVPHADLRSEVSFVAIKNGGHNGIGYMLDTGSPKATPERIPLSDIPRLIANACNVQWTAAAH
ncbi:MAG: alkaline phosphatase family protein [Sphingomonas sp.]|uniref:alkaline phosphatase family protein n=1 Tax=Sphingomonas sp. TaxID=28214 RepID=UPI001B0B1076|nr:alkaline phosphatase family protein [Sphingomonas sp.]MBO9622456.1 alkaline phosphatase family protein [Sphingomonas sp.]